MAAKADRLPAGWRAAKLTDVLIVDNRVIMPKRGSTYRYLGLEHVEQQTGRILDAPQTDGRQIASQKYVFGPQHVLYGKLRPNLNKVALPDFAGICSTDILPLAPRRSVFREYLAFYLRSPRFIHYATQKATGTKMPRLGVKQFQSARVPLPPLPVQERIVQILQKADDIRQKRQRAADLLRAVLPSVFNDMFGDLGTNPRGYPKESVGSVTTSVTSGYTPRGGARNYVPEGPLLLRSQNVRMLHLDLADCAHLPERIHEEMSRVRVLPGDVLLNITGASIGRVAWAGEDIPPANVNQHVCIIRADRTTVLPEYLAYTLATPWYQHVICNAPGSAQSGFNHSRVRALEILIPPIPVQHSFVMRVDALLAARAKHEAAVQDVTMALDTLFAQAFTGQLTAEWEASHVEEIAAQQALHERLPQLVLLALLRENARRIGQTAALLVTALMKYTFLLQMEGTSGRRLYHFVPYHYGPFAKELYADLEHLCEQGLVNVEDGGEERTKITLADPAGAEEALADLPEAVAADVVAALDEYGDLNYKVLLKTVYEKYPAYAKKSRLRRKAAKKAARRRPRG